MGPAARLRAQIVEAGLRLGLQTGGGGGRGAGGAKARLGGSAPFVFASKSASFLRVFFTVVGPGFIRVA